MDATLHWLAMSAAYAAVGLVIIGVLAYQNAWLGLLLAAGVGMWAARSNKRLRRLQDWYLWFPLQRTFHRLYIPTKKRIARALMCRVKKSVVADIIDSALRDAIDKRHISYHDYRELAARIGEALEITDLIPRGQRHKNAVRKTVLENVKAMRDSLTKVGHIPGKPEPKPETSGLEYLRNRRSAA